jgi:hypothetical protein
LLGLSIVAFVMQNPTFLSGNGGAKPSVLVIVTEFIGGGLLVAAGAFQLVRAWRHR